MTELRLGSLFDGIGVFPLAAVRCGIDICKGSFHFENLRFYIM